MKKNGLNISEQSISVDSIFGELFTLKFLPLGIHQDIARYNQAEKASFLDSFCAYYNGLSTPDRFERIKHIYEDICDLKTQYNIGEKELLESRYTGITPEEILETSQLVGSIIPANTAANDNPIPKIELTNKSALDVIGILRLVGNLSGIQAPNREVFLQKLKQLDIQGILEPEIYAQKYKLTLILEIPEMSTWEMIFSKLEEKYPEVQWTEKAA